MGELDLVVNGGEVYLDGAIRNVSLGVTNGRISHIVDPEVHLSADEVLELDGKAVLPGLVDGHVHLREPGYAEKEGIRSGTAAAAAGGITTIIEMPNTVPPVENEARLKTKRELFERKSHVDFALFGAVTPENIGTGDIETLVAGGVTAFKTFMATSFGPLLVDDKGTLFEAFEEIGAHNRPIYVHAEDQEYLELFTERANRERGLGAFFESRPQIAETTAINDIIDIVRETRTETVVPHVTTSDGIDRIDQARSKGYPIHAEVTPYHLAMNQEHLYDVGTVGIGTPPVRDESNRRELCSAVASGKIQLLGSDHAPHTAEEKQGPPLDVPPGMPQLETALPVTTHLAAEGSFSLSRIVECFAESPAKLHGLYPRKGSLQIGADADFVVVDTDRNMTVDSAQFESNGKYSPFDGWQLAGFPEAVYQRGICIAKEMAAVASPGDGCFLRPTS